MKEVKQRIENTKFWKKRMALSVVLIANGLVAKFFPDSINWIINTLFSWNKDIGALVVFVFFVVGPLAGGWCLIMGWSALEELKIRCKKCGRVISFEEAEAMGDNFRCPYCLNDTIKMNHPQTEEEIQQQTDRILGRIMRNIFRNMK